MNLDFKNKKGCSWESMDVYYDNADAVVTEEKDECGLDDYVQIVNDYTYASIAKNDTTIAALSGVE